jgi:hypothetical protein
MAYAPDAAQALCVMHCKAVRPGLAGKAGKASVVAGKISIKLASSPINTGATSYILYSIEPLS